MGRHLELARHRPLIISAVLVLGSMIPATIVIPVIRTFVSTHWPDREWLVHAFMTANLFGACFIGPALASWAERRKARRLTAATLAVIDGVMLLIAASTPRVELLLGARLIQGAASVGVVSLLMGSARSKSGSSATAMGVIGCAVVLSIVIGIPLGAISGRGGAPENALIVGGVIGVLVGLSAIFVMSKEPDAVSSPLSIRDVLMKSPALRLPVFVVALERAAVGAFVVTMQLHAHHVLGLPDRTVSTWFTLFLVTFALATWPAARASDRVAREKLIAGGALFYGVSIALLGVVSASLIPVLLVLGGLGSAFIYGPSLTLTGRSVPEASRGSAMAVLNAAGTLGMFLGNFGAFFAANVMFEMQLARATSDALIFGVAGLLQGGSMIAVLMRAKAPVAIQSGA